jgi:hypothetical protein
MAGALNTLFDKRRLALTRARFAAWWEGADFDEAATLAELEAKRSAANENSGDAEEALFDEPRFPLPPRVVALATLWGEGRIRPGDSGDEGLLVTLLALPGDAKLAVLGPGHAAPLIAFAGAHAGRIEAFEWREETLEALSCAVRKAQLETRVAVSRIDLEAHVFTPGAYDGLISIDDFAYCGYPPHLAQQIMKCLKPGAAALVECYVGLKASELATAFASSFAEPQIRAHGDILQFFVDAGLLLEGDEDLTAEFMGFAREGFKRLGASLNEAQLEPAAARELAWEAEAWRMRLKLLSQRRLERRRFLLRKPASETAEIEPANEAESAAKAEPAGRLREDNVAEVVARVLAEHEKKQKVK